MELRQKNGIYSGISNDEYHADKNTYSSSLIKMMEVPAIAKYKMSFPSEYKDCYRMGTAIHTKILEPHLFEHEFMLAINQPKRSAADKKVWSEWFFENGADGDGIVSNKAAEWYNLFEQQTHKHIITPDELRTIESMAESVKSNKSSIELLTNGEAEQSIYWTDSETGLNLRVRPDFLNHAISDLKSVQSAKPKSFASSAFNFGYHISQAMYQDGVYQVTGEFKKFKFICVEKTPPYLCAVHEFDAESAEEGYNQYREYLNKLAECLDSGKWPGLDNEIITLPHYAFKDNDLGLILDGVSI